MNYPDEILEFLISQGITSVAFNPEEADGSHLTSSLRSNDDIVSYYEFLRRLLVIRERWPNVRIRELDHIESALRMGEDQDVVSTENRLGANINISAMGDVSTFSPELLDLSDPNQEQFTWGNVHTQSWPQIMRHPHLIRTVDRIQEGVDECKRKCGFYSLCGGGAPSNKLQEKGSFATTATMACSIRVMAATNAVLDHYAL